METIAINGIAGTSKTTTLAKIISSLPQESEFVAVAFTHSAVQNLKRLVENKDKKHFKTIHSFFRIDFKTDSFLGSTRKVEYVFIDEFSMIDKELFSKILRDCRSNDVKRVFIAGDFLQLPKVGSIKNSIDTDTLQILEGFKINSLFLKVVKTFNSSPLLLVDNVFEKTQQFRNLNNNYLNWIVSGKFSEHLDEISFISSNEVEELISKGWTLIASKYKILERFRTDFKPGDLVYGTETTEDIVNGIVYEILSITEGEILAKTDDKLVSFHKPWPIYPLNLFTFHKSQGLTFENVIICVDDLFEFQMFYTGVTRSSNNIKFFTSKTANEAREYLKENSGEAEIQLLKRMFRRLFKNFQENSK